MSGSLNIKSPSKAALLRKPFNYLDLVASVNECSTGGDLVICDAGDRDLVTLAAPVDSWFLPASGASLRPNPFSSFALP
jgi:hypothetical protein